jgi:hypothetical protein
MKEVLVFVNWERISVTMKLGEEVIPILFFDHKVQRGGGERSFGDHVKWKGVMRNSFSGLAGWRRGDEKSFFSLPPWIGRKV